jgi:hypothetical protein
VYIVVLSSGVPGVKMTVVQGVSGVHDTVAETFAPPAVGFSDTVVVVIVVESIGSLNVTVTVAFVATSVAPIPGVRETIAGGVVSVTAAVRKLDVNCAASAFPARSFTAVVTVTV